MLSCCALLALMGGSAAAKAKPHVWLIVADDLGFGDLGYTGSDIQTPHIDRLAKGGVVLGHYYVNICCTPTRAMLNTGRYNIRYGLQTQVIPNNKRYGLNLTERILPQYMKEQGYATHAIGKWHLGIWKWQYTPTFRGYDSFLGYYGGSEDYFKHTEGGGVDFHLDIGANCGPNCSKTDFAAGGNYSSLVYTTRATTIISEHDSSTPLFLHTPFQSVHGPIQAPPKSVVPYAHLLPQRREFAGMLSMLDTAIGEVANCFAAKGMTDNLLTIFTTDNGGPVGSATNGHPAGIGDATGSQNWPLRGGKGAYYQGGVRGVAWVHGAMLHPSVVGTTSFELMHVTDILPTIVEAAGGDAAASAPTGHPLDGVSQWGVLTDGATGTRTSVLINIERENPTTAAHNPNKPGGGCNGEAQYVVIKGAHKLIVGGGGQPNTWYHDGLPYAGSDPVPEGGCITACSVPNASACPATPHLQVFDVIADEAERHNLAGQNATLDAELMALVKSYNASHYVRALSIVTPVSTGCPFVDKQGAVTPCTHAQAAATV